MNQLLNTAITAALEAGKSILEIYHSGEFNVEIKGDNSPLTKADKASHNMIMSFLTKTNIPVLSEEGKVIPYEERKDWKRLAKLGFLFETWMLCNKFVTRDMSNKIGR